MIQFTPYTLTGELIYFYFIFLREDCQGLEIAKMLKSLDKREMFYYINS